MSPHKSSLLALLLASLICHVAAAEPPPPPVDATPQALAPSALEEPTSSPPPPAGLENSPAPAVLQAQLPRKPEPRFRNRAMMIAGIVFTGIGVGAAGSCIALAVKYDRLPPGSNNDAYAILAGASIGLCTAAGGSLAVGIPLWAVGGRKGPERPSLKTSWSRPELLLGRQSLHLRWTF